MGTMLGGEGEGPSRLLNGEQAASGFDGLRHSPQAPLGRAEACLQGTVWAPLRALTARESTGTGKAATGHRAVLTGAFRLHPLLGLPVPTGSTPRRLKWMPQKSQAGEWQSETSFKPQSLGCFPNLTKGQFHQHTEGRS